MTTPCYICRTTDQQGMIRSNCACRGTGGHVHEACLRAMVISSGRPRCPACNTMIPLKQDGVGCMPILAFLIRLMIEIFFTYHGITFLFVDIPAWTGWATTTPFWILTMILAFPTLFFWILHPDGFALVLSIRGSRGGSILALLVAIVTLYVLALIMVWPFYFYKILLKAREAYRQETLRRAAFVLR